MNTLSWFIYFAGVVGGIKDTILILSLFGLLFIGWVAAYSSIEEGNHKYIKFNLIPVFFICLASLLPNKETMYAIAASEMGEKILKTETAGKVQQALNAWLDAQVKQISKKD